MTITDANALASVVAAPDIAAVAPIKNSSLSLTAGSANWTTTVVGTSPSWLSVRARTLAEGRFLTDQDDTDRAAVTVLGSDTATELFGSTDVVGRTVKINDIEFSVVGVLAPAGSDASANLDDQALVPLSTSANRLVGGTSRNAVSTIYLQQIRS